MSSQSSMVQQRQKNLLLSNLKQINILLPKLIDDHRIFMRNFPVWRQHRTKTILIFAKLKSELDSVQLASSNGADAARGMDVLGVLIALLGFGLSFHGNESVRSLGRKMRNGGTLLGFTGTAASISSAVIGCGLSKKIIDEAQKYLEEDQLLTKKLMPWVQHSTNLARLFEEVFDCSILSDVVKDMFSIFDEISILCDKGSNALQRLGDILSSNIQTGASSIAYSIIENHGVNMNKIERKIENITYKAKLVIRHFCDDTRVREAILKISNTIRNSPAVVEFPKLCRIFMCNIYNLNNYDIFFAVMPAVGLAALTRSNMLSACFFQAISIAANGVARISLANNSENNSKFSETLKKIKKVLLIELEYLENEYQKLCI